MPTHPHHSTPFHSPVLWRELTETGETWVQHGPTKSDAISMAMEAQLYKFLRIETIETYKKNAKIQQPVCMAATSLDVSFLPVALHWSQVRKISQASCCWDSLCWSNNVAAWGGRQKLKNWWQIPTPHGTKSLSCLEEWGSAVAQGSSWCLEEAKGRKIESGRWLGKNRQVQDR